MVQGIPQQIAQHADEIRTAAVGLSGTGASVVLQDFNQFFAGMAGLATFVYVCIKIYFHFKDRIK